MAHIHLFREHANYQAGKSRLKTGAVIHTHNFWIYLVLFAALALLMVGGNSLRWQWRFDAVGQETVGTVTGCEEMSGGKGSYTTYVEYRYSVNETVYYGRDRVGGGRLCRQYPLESSYPAYYLSDAPEEAGLGAFLHDIDWRESQLFAAMGIGLMLFVFFLMMKNRKEWYQYNLLKARAEELIEATVEKVGRVEGKHGYNYADYVFTTPDGDILKGQIRSGRSYAWPHKIKRFDSLTILYLDNENYCVL